MERATTTQRSSANGEQMTEQQVEQRNLGDPSSGLRMSMLVAGAVLPGPSGAQAIRTIRMREADAGFEVIEVDISKSDSVLSIDIANPSKTPK